MKEKKIIEKKNTETDIFKNVPLDMYSISGHSKIITKTMLKRYLDCNNHDVESALDYSSRIKAIQTAHKADKLALIEGVFNVDFPTFKMIIPDLMLLVPNEEKLEWIKLGLQSFNPKVWSCVCYMIPSLYRDCWDEITPLIRQKIDDILNSEGEKAEDIAIGVQMISFLPEEEQIIIIKKLLVHNNLTIQKYAAWTVKYLSNVPELVEMCLTSNNIIIQQAGIDNLEKYDFDDRKKYLKIFNKQLLANVKNNKDNEEVLLKAFFLADYLSKDNKIELVKLGVEHPNLIVREEAYWIVSNMPEKEWEKISIFVVGKLVDIFNNKEMNQDQIKFIISTLVHLTKESMEKFIKLGLEEMINNKVDEKCILLFKIFGVETQEALIRLNLPKEFIDEFFANSLYKDYPINDKKFKRQEFKKTGSKTILLGGTLKDKIIVRYIKPHSFLIWKYLYENNKMWKKHGFDYVPLEPIVSYDLCKDNLVRVFSGVLDLNLDELTHKTRLYTKELYDQRNKIIVVLKKEGIIHGHCHDRNFVVRFFRNEDDSIDLSKTPRLFLIDLDEAELSWED